MGIKVVRELQGVGENLREHPAVFLVYAAQNEIPEIDDWDGDAGQQQDSLSSHLRQRGFEVCFAMGTVRERSPFSRERRAVG